MSCIIRREMPGAANVVLATRLRVISSCIIERRVTGTQKTSFNTGFAVGISSCITSFIA